MNSLSNTWSALDCGLNSTVSDIAVNEKGEVFVGGMFTTAGGVSANRVAKWNGSSWSTMGSGISDGTGVLTAVRAIAVNGMDIYAGGAFTTAGGKPSLNFAHWKEISTSIATEDRNPQGFEIQQNYPNPFKPSTTIRYTIARPSYVRLKVFNLLGQEVANLVNENKPAGRYEVRWRPLNLPSGVYLYRLQAGDFVETRKLVLLE
jgi:hypothetical protein